MQKIKALFFIWLCLISIGGVAAEVNPEIGIVSAHSKSSGGYFGLGYLADSNLGVRAFFWGYEEPTTGHNTYSVYDPACAPQAPTCQVIGTGTTKWTTVASRLMAALAIDYTVQVKGVDLSAGAAYLNRTTDINDRLTPTMSVVFKGAGQPCGLTLRALAKFGLVGLQCTL